MGGRLDDDFVRPDRRHAIEDSVGVARRVALDAIERPKMRVRADLPIPLRGQLQQHGRLEMVFRTQRAGIAPVFSPLRMSDHNPTARDGVFA